MKKIILFFILLGLKTNTTLWAEPHIECGKEWWTWWLPWCDTTTLDALDFIQTIVAELIKYVAVVAVIALIVAWFMYIFSWGEDEKTKKAKKWIIWSIVAVFISISWYFLINLLNDTTFNV